MKLAHLILFTSLAAGSASAGCLDFSYKKPFLGMQLRMKQVGCEKVIFQQFHQDQALGTPWEAPLSETFVVDHVDDKYETYDRSTRFFLAPDGSALIHEVTFDGVDKATGTKTFKVIMERFSFDAAGKLKQKTSTVSRVAKTAGVPELAFEEDEAELEQNP